VHGRNSHIQSRRAHDILDNRCLPLHLALLVDMLPLAAPTGPFPEIDAGRLDPIGRGLQDFDNMRSSASTSGQARDNRLTGDAVFYLDPPAIVASPCGAVVIETLELKSE
jgi:hypothetical protein